MLVHCYEGKSRSVTILTAYLMCYERMTLKGALDLLRSKKPDVKPNKGFLVQLQEFEVAQHGRTSVQIDATKPGKPAARLCPYCHRRVGVSKQSLIAHVKKAHPEYAQGQEG